MSTQALVEGMITPVGLMWSLAAHCLHQSWRVPYEIPPGIRALVCAPVGKGGSSYPWQHVLYWALILMMVMVMRMKKLKEQENQGKRSLFAIYSGYLTAFLRD